MFRVLNCLTTAHDWRLLGLAAIVCLFASLAAVMLFRQARASVGRMRAMWLMAAGAASGCSIWATHFIAMLAYDAGVAVGYDVGLTLLSLLVAVVMTSLGLALALSANRSWHAAACGALIGIGIAGMHYLGMSALQLPGVLTWSADLVGVSIVLGVAFAAAATAVAVRGDDLRTVLAASALLALAILSHHFVAMGAVTVLPDPSREIGAASLSPATMAVATAVVALWILSMCMLAALAARLSAERLHEQHLRLAMATNNMPNGLVMFDRHRRVAVCNRRYLEMYDLPEGVVKPGCSFADLMRERIARGMTKEDADSYLDALENAFRTRQGMASTLELKDGRTIFITHQPMADGGWLATHEDITQRRQTEARIAYLAQHDSLTGVPNRAAFNDKLAQAMARADADGGSFGLICLDLDRFKEINDVFGHGAGDDLLCEAARHLNAVCGDAFVARLGGDEFALITTPVIEPDALARVGDRLLSINGQEFLLDGYNVRVGASVGVALYPQDGGDPDTLRRNADAALYRAKEEGRATIRFFEAGMDERLRERRMLQQDLKSALARDELILHYQPQAALVGDVIGFEALLRWMHPERGLIAPNVFVPVAEESGLIIPIGEWVLREACREAASWEKPLQIAVNLSAVQFQHGNLPQTVAAILAETGLPGCRLELEITESVLIGDFARALSILRQLKTLGVRIAMDDFGTGYSSLSYLQSFPFDKIKIDRSFIANIDTNPQSAAIVRAVLGLGRGLGLPVLAEGVETEAQLAFLVREHCSEVQGYLIGRPELPANYATMIARPGAPPPSREMALAS